MNLYLEGLPNISIESIVIDRSLRVRELTERLDFCWNSNDVF